MVNGKLETWQVMKWLKKHPKHRGEAPETDSRRAQRVNTALRGEVVFGFMSKTRGWVGDSFPSHRSDWTVYSERGLKVKFKRKAVSRAVLIDALRRIHDEIDGTVACEPGGPLQNAIMHAGEVLRKLGNG